MAFVSLTFTILIIQSTISYELIQKLPLGMGTIDIESVVYDTSNNRWLVASWYNGAIFPFTRETINNAIYDLNNQSMYYIPNPFGSIPPQLNIWRTIYADAPFSNGNVGLNYTSWRPAGMEVVNNKLYVVDFYFGRVVSWDLTTDSLENMTFITNTDGFPANLDGLCHDPDNPEMLYITDFGQNVGLDGSFYNTGYEAIYALNTDDWSWTRIYDTTMYINGIPSSTTDYTITANGCIVYDGILYAVDYKLDHDVDKSWIMYDISNSEWTVDFDILPNGGDGLVYVPEIDTFYASDVENGTLLKYSPGMDTKFEIIYFGMIGPADMDYNPNTQTIAIAELFSGFVNFIQIDHSLFTTTSFYTTESPADQGNIINVVLSMSICFVVVLYI